MSEFIESLLIVAIYLLPLFAVLLVCGVLADYVLPHCPRLIRFMERVFDVDLEGGYEDD